jgi:hypothetical protein
MDIGIEAAMVYEVNIKCETQFILVQSQLNKLLQSLPGELLQSLPNKLQSCVRSDL